MMLTSSALEEDRARAAGLNAASYLVKPASFAQLLSLVKEVHRDWLEAQAQ
jgi:DNA-binding response OmpR family regulator